MDDLRTIAADIRKKIIVMHAKAKSSHVGSCFSCVDILAVLYFKILKIFPENPHHLLRDRFILSKGHASSALYTTLSFRGLIPKDWLEDFDLDGGRFVGHVDRFNVPFIEASTGSLGHGLPIGLGMAHALQLSGIPARVFVLMSDGEIQEGSVWEAAHIASRLKMDNLVGIVDANGLQSFAKTDEIMPIDSFKAKWESFGWSVAEVNGHDLSAMEIIFNQLPLTISKPSLIIARTIKGQGIKSFEDQLGSHYWSPKPEDVEAYLKELDEKHVC